MDETVYICALNSVFQFRPAVCREVMNGFDDLSELFTLKEKELFDLFRDNAVARQLSDPGLLERSYRELEWAGSRGVAVVTVRENRYPVLLRECKDAPVLLYYAGTADLNQPRPVSVVGTRLASSYGRETCAGIVASLAGSDPLVISGLAYGIDVCAHKAALAAGLKTIGILPSGIDCIYPAAHRSLVKQMVEQGGILTEFPHGTPPQKWHFIKRNRILAGMVQAVIVIESRIKGGAMSTVEFANSYNREVYAVPGRMCDTNSYGCNYLIAKNMACLYNLENFLRMPGWDGCSVCTSAGQPGLFSFNDDKKGKILLSLNNNSVLNLEAVCLATGLAFPEAAALILELELEGKVQALRGNRYKKI